MHLVCTAVCGFRHVLTHAPTLAQWYSSSRASWAHRAALIVSLALSLTPAEAASTDHRAREVTFWHYGHVNRSFYLLTYLLPSQCSWAADRLYKSEMQAECCILSRFSTVDCWQGWWWWWWCELVWRHCWSSSASAAAQRHGLTFNDDGVSSILPSSSSSYWILMHATDY